MTKESKFIILSLNKDNKNLIDFFDKLFCCSAYEKDNYLIYRLTGNSILKDYNLEYLIDNIKVDFNEEVKIFETCVFNKNIEDFEKLLEIYSVNNQKPYMNISKLAEKLYENNDDLSLIKSITLNVLNEDLDLHDIAKAMFKSNLNVSKSASIAYMHRNTVINKLDTLYKKTCFNIQNFKDAFILYLFMNK